MSAADARSLSSSIRAIGDSIMQHPDPLRAITRHVRLFYDGGARGNPGRSGAGSVLLEYNEMCWQIVWWQATYCGARQTNNFAEHVGVAVGLEECARRYQDQDTQIKIIGDSALVTRQLRGTAAIRKAKLHAPYERSMTALASLPHYELLHTRRGGNKMADKLANEAMNRQTTIGWIRGCTAHADVTSNLATLLPGDCATPLSTLRPTPTLSDQLRQKYGLTAPTAPTSTSSSTAKKRRTV